MAAADDAGARGARDNKGDLGLLARSPAVLRALEGLLRSGKHNRRVARAARDQLSGQLAELAGAGPLTRTALTKMAGHIFDKRAWYTPRHYAAIIGLRQVGRVLGVPGLEGLRTEGTPDREAASHVYAKIIARPPAAIRKAARTAWEQLFGCSMPAMSRTGS